MISKSREDYLKEIYSLFKKTGQQDVKSVSIATGLMVSKAAVSKMLRKMQTENMIRVKPYAKTTLTKKGLKIAKKITFKHRLIEFFLSNTLGLDKKSAHKEAHILEHVISDRTTKKLADFLHYQL